MTDRRATSRRRVCLGGRIRPAAFLPEIDCTLRDVSLDGARLRIAAGAVLPARFDLTVPCRGQTRRARLVWRAGDAAGLRFEDAPADACGPVAPADGVPGRSMPPGEGGPGRLH